MRRLPPLTIIPPHLYVERGADRQLARNLTEMGRPAYILVARQMGKTNLLLHAKRSLERPDDLFLYQDLSKPFESARDCFRQIIDTAAEQLLSRGADLQKEIAVIRKEELPAYREYERELRLILANVRGRFVIILDEIDSLTKTTFSDTIFAQIRSSYFERTNVASYERLTYVLSGVAEPNDLIRDKRISPFNIGEEVYLEDFSRSEVDRFLVQSGLQFPRETVEALFAWTGGNPRMTWDLCSALEDTQKEGLFPYPELVDELVQKLYLSEFNRAPVDHMRELLVTDAELRRAVRALQTKEAGNLAHAERRKLYLAGIVGPLSKNEPVRIKCRIIEEALNVAWIADIEQIGKGPLQAAEDYYRAGEYNEALRFYEMALPELSLDASPRRMSLFHKIGYCAYEVGEYAKGIEFLDAAGIDPEDNQLLYRENRWLVGLCQTEMGRYADSVKTFEQVASFEKNDRLRARCLMDLGSVLYASNPAENSHSAIARVEDALKHLLDPSCAIDEEERKALITRAHWKIAAIVESDDPSRAATHYRKALECSAASSKPFLLAGLLSVSNSAGEKHGLLKELVDTIIAEKLASSPAHPDRPLDLTADALSEYLYLAAKIDPLIFERLLSHLQRNEDAGAASVTKLLHSAGLQAILKDDVERAKVLLRRSAAENAGTSKNVFYETLLYLCVFEDEAEAPFDGYLDALYDHVEQNAISVLDIRIFCRVLPSLIRTDKIDEAGKWVSLFTSNADNLRSSAKVAFSAVYAWELLYLEVIGSTKLVEKAKSLLDYAKRIRLESRVTENEIKDLTEAENYARNCIDEQLPQSRVMKGLNAGYRYGRNDRLTVRYSDGRIVERIKFKKISEDVLTGRCAVIRREPGRD